MWENNSLNHHDTQIADVDGLITKSYFHDFFIFYIHMGMFAFLERDSCVASWHKTPINDYHKRSFSSSIQKQNDTTPSVPRSDLTPR